MFTNFVTGLTGRRENGPYGQKLLFVQMHAHYAQNLFHRRAYNNNHDKFIKYKGFIMTSLATVLYFFNIILISKKI